LEGNFDEQFKHQAMEENKKSRPELKLLLLFVSVIVIMILVKVFLF